MSEQTWPSWRYGSGGESCVFQCPGDVPPGWEDTPDAFKRPLMEVPVPALAAEVEEDRLIWKGAEEERHGLALLREERAEVAKQVETEKAQFNHRRNQPRKR